MASRDRRTMGRLSSLLLLLMRFLADHVQTEGKVPAVIVFGDSSVDAGNNNVITTVLKSNFRPYGRDFYGGQPTGRFSNGRVATDFISEAVGLKPTVPAYLDPAYTIEDFLTGVCFASAGTGFDNATSDVLSVIPLWRELELFEEYTGRLTGLVGRREAEHVVREALYIVSLGTNDFLENYYLLPRRSAHFTAEQYQDFLIRLAGDFLSRMYHLGARKISMTGLMPMGCLPLERSANYHSAPGRHECVEEYNDVSKSFNRKLSALVQQLNAALPGLRMVFSHVYDQFLSIIRSPSSYGYENAEEGCCATGRYEMGYMCDQWNPFTCRDADKYVFWDAFHPTEKTSRILAHHTLNTTLAPLL